jgi:hypothetical protein
MRSGNNNLLFQATILDYLDDKSIRYFKNGAATVRGIPSFSYCHRPTASNAALGSVDFSVVNQPTIFWGFNPAPPAGYGGTVALWSTQDIGFASALVISGIFFTWNNVDVTNYDAIRMLRMRDYLIIFYRSLQLRRRSCSSLLIFLHSTLSVMLRCAIATRESGASCYSREDSLLEMAQLDCLRSTSATLRSHT